MLDRKLIAPSLRIQRPNRLDPCLPVVPYGVRPSHYDPNSRRDRMSEQAGPRGGRCSHARSAPILMMSVGIPNQRVKHEIAHEHLGCCVDSGSSVPCRWDLDCRISQHREHPGDRMVRLPIVACLTLIATHNPRQEFIAEDKPGACRYEVLGDDTLSTSPNCKVIGSLWNSQERTDFGAYLLRPVLAGTRSPFFEQETLSSGVNKPELRFASKLFRAVRSVRGYLDDAIHPIHASAASSREANGSEGCAPV